MFVQRRKPISSSSNSTECRFLISGCPIGITESASLRLFATKDHPRGVQASSTKVWLYSRDLDSKHTITSSTSPVVIDLTCSTSPRCECGDKSFDSLLCLTHGGRASGLARADNGHVSLIRKE